MTRRLVLFMAFCLLAVTASCYVPAANAASSYDEAIQVTTSLELKDSSGKVQLDASRSYMYYAEQVCPSRIASLQNAGSVAVSLYRHDATNNKQTVVSILWRSESAYPLNWDFWNGASSVWMGGVIDSSLRFYWDNGQVIGDCNRHGQYISGSETWFQDMTVEVFASTFAPNYPSGYEGASIPSEPPAAKYVAMGDSFSSGEGNPLFEAETSQGGVNECHRSPKAYPRLLQQDPGLDLGPTAFVACSGATTASIMYGGSGVGAWDELPQMSQLSPATKLVTITIGGNDIKFEEFAAACVTSNCSSSSDEYQEAWDIMTDSGRPDYLPDQLEIVLGAIADGLTVGNTTAQVYVIGYPDVITHDAWTSTTSSDPWNCLYVSEISAAGAEDIVIKLNDVISTAVAAFDDSRFVYVDPLDEESPFIGHELCRSDGYFNGIEATVPPHGKTRYLFHPNNDGQEAYKQLVKDAMP